MFVPTFGGIKLWRHNLNTVLEELWKAGYEYEYNDLLENCEFRQLGFSLKGLRRKVDMVSVYPEDAYSPERMEEARQEIEEAYPPGSAEQRLPPEMLRLVKKLGP